MFGLLIFRAGEGADGAQQVGRDLKFCHALPTRIWPLILKKILIEEWCRNSSLYIPISVYLRPALRHRLVPGEERTTGKSSAFLRYNPKISRIIFFAIKQEPGNDRRDTITKKVRAGVHLVNQRTVDGGHVNDRLTGIKIPRPPGLW
jgi:hypothetical protein